MDRVALMCISWFSKKKSPPQVGYGAPTVYGYGRVNFANCDWGKTEKDIRRCAAKGVRAYIWEMCGWGKETIWNNSSRVGAAKDIARRTIELCRALGMVAIPIATNWNITLSKLGHVGLPLSKFLAEAQGLVLLLKSLGPKNVIVQIASENPHNATDWNAFIAWAANELAGFDLADNHDSQTLTRQPWAKYRAWHSSGISSIPSGAGGDCLAIGDHSTLIRQLSTDGTLEGAGNPDAIAQWCANNNGMALVGYYALWRDENDYGAIDALGKAAK